MKKNEKMKKIKRGSSLPSAIAGVTVSSSSTINLSVCSANKPGGCSLTGLPVLTSITSSDFHSWEDHLSSMFHSEWFDELAPNTGLSVHVCCTFNELRGIWLSDFVFPRLSDVVEASTLGFLALHCETKFIIGFDFAVTLSSLAPSCVLFDITSRQLVELKWLMLNKHKRWFQSSRVKFHFVSMSASWFLVSIYLIWILGSKLILSNNQSRATL